MDDVLLQIMWTQYIIECQGYVIDLNIIYRDSMRTIVLESKGNDAGSKRTKHIKVRYFFVKDKIA